MKLKNLIEMHLRENKEFRERKNKDRGMIDLMLGVNLVSVADSLRQQMFATIKCYASMDRSWRQLLQNNPELRGKDYNMKDELELKAQGELGYNV